MSHTYAIVKDSVVENIIVWDEESDWKPPGNSVMIKINQPCSIGWIYDGNQFLEPHTDSNGEVENLAIQDIKNQLDFLNAQLNKLLSANNP